MSSLKAEFSQAGIRSQSNSQDLTHHCCLEDGEGHVARSTGKFENWVDFGWEPARKHGLQVQQLQGTEFCQQPAYTWNWVLPQSLQIRTHTDWHFDFVPRRLLAKPQSSPPGLLTYTTVSYEMCFVFKHCYSRK